MNRLLKLSAVLVCALALCVGLAACGGGSDVDKSKKAFAGTWELVSMDENGKITAEEDVAIMKSFGMTVVLHLNDDGSASLDTTFNNTMNMEGTWTPKTATTASATLAGGAVDMTIKDNVLSFKQVNTTMNFRKSESAASAGASSGAASSGASEVR